MKNWMKIFILGLIIITLGGIYYFKNVGKNEIKNNTEVGILNWEYYDPQNSKSDLPVLLELGSPT